MLSSRNRQIAFALGVVVLLIALGLVGAYVGGEATRDRAAEAEATPGGPPVETLPDCPWGEASCVLALGIEHALQSANVGAVMDFAEPRTYFCPGGEPAPGGPFPLCEGVGEFESREGIPYAQRYSNQEILDKSDLRDAIRAFVERVNSEAEDAFGSGGLLLHAFGCPERAVPFQNIGCARLAIVFTAILGEGESAERELLIFWAMGNFRGRTLPVTEVWVGQILPDEHEILFETGGVLPDLGEVYIIDQSLRGDTESSAR